MTSRFLKSILLIAGLGLGLPAALADGDHGRHSRLSPPDGAANADARGEVVLNSAVLIVKVRGLAEGEYEVLLDDGTGTKTAIGTITVAGEDDEDEDDGPGGGHGRHEDNEGILKLSGDKLPFGAASGLDLAGRAICVKDKDGNVVLQGTTPKPIEPEPQRRNGRCPLSRPDPAPDADAEGVLKLESDDGRLVIKVHLTGLEPEKVFEVVFTKPDDSASESVGKVTTNDGGNGQFKLDSKKGDTIPFGVASLSELVGYKVSVKDEAGVVVLVGTVCEPKPEEDDDDHPEPVKPRCFTASLDGAQEVPPVDTTATGTGEVHLTGRDGTTLKYEVKVEGLSGPATAAHIHTGAVGVPGPVLIPLDAATLKGEVEVTAEQIAAIQSGDTYVNVHTEAHPDGEIRGQLTVCPDDDEDDEDDEDEKECEADLARPDPAPDADAEGEVELSARELEVEGEKLAADATFDVVLTDPAAGGASETIGQLKTNAEGEGELELEPEEGAALPFGKASLADLAGFLVAVKDSTGAVVLQGALPTLDCLDDEEDDDDHHGHGDGDDEEDEDDEHEDGGHRGPGGGGVVEPAEVMFLMVGDFDTPFLRGEVTGDGSVDISDSMRILTYLFGDGLRPYCMDAADANDDGEVDIADPIAVLLYLFLGGASPAEPGATIAGSDPTADALYCQE